MTTSDPDVEPDDPGADPGVVIVDDPTDPTVDRLARAIDPPGRLERLKAVPGRALAALGASPLEAWVTLGVVLGCVAFVFSQLGPGNIFSDSTPAGGDMGAHVWGPAFMRDHLLPSFRLTGWTPDWYAGMPAYHFYMVLPSLVIALLSFVIPYGVAFKLVAISGLVTLPVAAWAFGRLTRLPFPAPPLLAVGATAFLFDRSYSILGGNIASTMAGEFAFSISLSFALLFLGVVGRGMETGRHRALAAVLLALTGLTHLIPLLFAIGASLAWIVVSAFRRPDSIRVLWDDSRPPPTDRGGLGPILRDVWGGLVTFGRWLGSFGQSGVPLRTWWLFGAGAVGSALTMWWLLPFYLRSPYMNDMGWEKRTQFVDLLFRRENLDGGLTDSPRIELVLVLAFLGLVMSIAWRRRAGAFLVLAAVGVAIAFVVVPQGRLWNARLLPFYYLMLYLLAAVGIAELGRTIATLVARDPAKPPRSVTAGTAVAACLVVLVALAMPLRSLPGGSVQADGSYRWLFLSTTDSSFLGSWARWNFSGYENKPAYPEYHGIVSTMAELGETEGCGRAMWEHESAHDRYGTPMALMLLPFWTDGCIGSSEGLFFESSSTTPYHFLMQDELSSAPSNAQRDLPYSPGAPTQTEFDIGVQHMQLLGIRYYMAISEPMIEKAQASPSLTEVATSGPWAVFTVADSDQVVVLEDQPAVLTGVDPGHGWLDAVVPWFEDPTQWSVFLAAGGPDEWQRIAPGETPERIPNEPVAVTDVETGTDTISFQVSQPGTPVLVKTSYFPNWQAEGANGPWRISPNLMVVVPTETQVTLRYGMTGIDWLGWLVAALGLVGLVALWRAVALSFPEPRSRLSRAGSGHSPPAPSAGGGTAGVVGAPNRGGATEEPSATGPGPDAGVPADSFDPASVILSDPAFAPGTDEHRSTPSASGAAEPPTADPATPGGDDPVGTDSGPVDPDGGNRP